MYPKKTRCPDQELLSALYDGEVVSPWKESLEEHVRECEACQKSLAGFQRVSSLLGKDSLDEARVARSMEKVHRSLGNNVTPLREPSLWRRRISLPLPAAAAAAFFLVVSGFLLPFVSGKAASPEADILVRHQQGLEWAEGDMQALLEAMEKDESFYHEVEWQIPEITPLHVDGMSQMIRQVDYRGGGQ